MIRLWCGSALAIAVLSLVGLGGDIGNAIEVEATVPGLERNQGLLYLDGRLFTGRLVERYDNGSLDSETEYRAGQREGAANGWYPNGQREYERLYKDGRKHGEHIGWWQDGLLHFVYRFENGLHQGNAREWYPDGLPYRDFTYVDGKEEGSQRMWHTDGSIRANYVIKNGRRFGLIGSKGCVGTGMSTEEVVG